MKSTIDALFLQTPMRAIHLPYLECKNTKRRELTDATRIPVKDNRPPPPQSTKNPNCGCPYEAVPDPCLICQPNRGLQVRIVRRPRRCIKMPCNYAIPAINCNEERRPPREPRANPLCCIDWVVDEPGPNESYGLHGLNWYDWEMKGVVDKGKLVSDSDYVPAHPGFSKERPHPSDKVYMANLPVECYARSPTPCKPVPFATDVNYFRDWRCCEAKPPRPFRPPYAQWATNRYQ